VAVALITIDVHNRDIVETLAQQQCSSLSDFAWQMQLRYYWDAEQDSIAIHQVNARYSIHNLDPVVDTHEDASYGVAVGARIRLCVQFQLEVTCAKACKPRVTLPARPCVSIALSHGMPCPGSCTGTSTWERSPAWW
jgi:hypothetical protein